MTLLPSLKWLPKEHTPSNKRLHSRGPAVTADAIHSLLILQYIYIYVYIVLLYLYLISSRHIEDIYFRGEERYITCS
jgi:hypothetical protein